MTTATRRSQGDETRTRVALAAPSQSTIECIEVAKVAIGSEIAPPPEGTDDDQSFWISTLRACQNLALFEAIATEAGPDLTNQSFEDAVGRVELPPLPLYPFASLGTDKPDARDTLSVLEWDPDLADFVETAGPFDVRE